MTDFDGAKFSTIVAPLTSMYVDSDTPRAGSAVHTGRNTLWLSLTVLCAGRALVVVRGTADLKQAPLLLHVSRQVSWRTAAASSSPRDLASPAACYHGATNTGSMRIMAVLAYGLTAFLGGVAAFLGGVVIMLDVVSVEGVGDRSQ